VKGTGRKKTSKAGERLLRDYESQRENIRRCYENYFLLKRQSQSKLSEPSSANRWGHRRRRASTT
jgi:hypothetical protein